MELLIPGLILVALMVWASTKIKKTAADAFEVENIKTDNYALQKPQGFLHVLGDSEHEFYAYSKEFGEGSNKLRRATIEIDILKATSISEVRDKIFTGASDAEIVLDTVSMCELETEESANENSIRGFYKIVGTQTDVYRLRVAVLSSHLDEYLDRVNETLDSFSVRTN